MVGIVLVLDAGVTGRRELVAVDLDKAAGLVAPDDDELLAGDPAEDLLADEGLRHRVGHRSEANGLVVSHDPGLAEGGGVGLGGDGVHAGPFLTEHLGRRPAGLCVRSGVELGHHLLTRSCEVTKARVVRE